jgi:Family of unknown function (DUF6262)
MTQQAMRWLMRADNSGHLIDAARRRSQVTEARAVAALRRMDNAGIAVSFESVAEEAGVSRSWLYTHSELRGEIERLRGRRNSTTRSLIPDRQRISDASLVRRLEVASERIRELQSDNRRLRDALAEALGANRAVIGGPIGRKHGSAENISGALGPS